MLHCRIWLGRYTFDLAFENVIKVAVVSHPSLLQVPADLEVRSIHSVICPFMFCLITFPLPNHTLFYVPVYPHLFQTLEIYRFLESAPPHQLMHRRPTIPTRIVRYSR